jgi:Major Facilitator Superfamily.
VTERVPPERSTHPVLFLLMFVPMGISNGFVTVTLGFLLQAVGVGTAAIAVLGNWSLVPQNFKFALAPLVDATLTNKAWYLIAAAATGGLVLATGFIPVSASNLTMLTVFVFLISIASALTALAADSIMAHATTPEQKGRAGGWSQAGNLGGSAIGGGLGLWLAQNLTPGGDAAIGAWLTRHTGIEWFAGAGLWLGQHVQSTVIGSFAVGLMCLSTIFALLYVHEPPAEHRAPSFVNSMINVGKDVWTLVKSRKGLVVFVAMWLPIGAAAMTQLWAAVASDWHASGNWVVLINGLLGGIISMVGCIAGGWICDRVSRMTAFNAFSILTALLALAAAFSPRTQAMYILYVGLYQLAAGFCYASWGAVVLEAIGKGAAATKYNVLAGIANFPIQYVAYLDGTAHDAKGLSWLPLDGAGRMMLTEAIVPIMGTVILIGFWLLTKPLYRAKPSA